MYKHASRNLQRRYAVDKPQATGGALAAGEALLPDVSHMTMAEAVSERQQYIHKRAQLENQRIVAKADHDHDAAARIGAALAQCCSRLGALKTHITAMNVNSSADKDAWKKAIREILDDEAWEMICARQQVLRAEIEAGREI